MSEPKNKDKSQRQGGFLGRAKVNRLMLVSMLEGVQYLIMQATDRVIVGQMLGSDAIAGVMVVAPVFDLVSVFQSLITAGTVILYTRAIADYNDHKRRTIFGMAIVIAVILGLILSGGAILFEDLFLDVTGAQGSVREYARQYLFFYKLPFLIQPLLFLLQEFLYVEGDEIRFLAGHLSLLVGNALLTFILIPYMGMLGASLGSAFGIVLSFCIVLSHYVSRKYRLKPVFTFNADYTREMIFIGIADSFNDLFNFAYIMLLNMFVIRRFGVEYLAVIAVSDFVYDMMSIGGGVNEAMKTMLISYRGDRNEGAMKSLFIYALKITFVLAVIFIGVVWFLAPFLPALFGIEEAEMTRLTIWACRLTSLSVLAVIINELFLEYFIDIGKYFLSIAGNFLDSLLVRFSSNVLFALGFGIYGIWVGEAVCTYISVTIMAAIILWRYGKKQFPFLLDSDSGNSLSISYRAVTDEIMEARDRTEAFLREKNVPGRALNLSMVFVEDMSMMINEANPGEKAVNIDIFITCHPENLQLVLWSDGKNMDIADADAVPENLRSFFISSLIAGFDESKYQQTAGYNRASFIIPYRQLAVNTSKE
ncbi:MAG: hypothetical protein IJU93_07095 [Lachnospiraceae bacterium]|nr:hypothetical protein [Lachnospiraceae bacterium]